jgi:hypothetical protein
VTPGKDAAEELVLRAEGDTLFVRPVGTLPVEQAQRILRLAEQSKAQHGHLFLLVDLQLAGLLPPESRRLMARFGAENPPLAVALFHVSPAVRAVNALLFGAIKLLGQKRLNVVQFSTEKEARDWLGAERKRLLPGSDSGQKQPA